ncbi:hypothetical protein KSC_037850 [Ktedonobacter sp. SOSP1-52]|nr:hypothetical protein KSC_037850 [Ktedonobacter sp. SOSP1-52]
MLFALMLFFTGPTTVLEREEFIMVWTTNRIVALALGVVFTLIGIVGFFIPAENSTGVQALFGIFDVDTVHNIIHLVTGVLGIAAAFTGQSRIFNQVFGIVYALLGLVGLIPALYLPAGSYGHDNGLFLGLTHINAADHILHIVVGVVAAAVGFFVRDTTTYTTPTDTVAS